MKTVKQAIKKVLDKYDITKSVTMVVGSVEDQPVSSNTVAKEVASAVSEWLHEQGL
jgi:hypothetical protein